MMQKYDLINNIIFILENKLNRYHFRIHYVYNLSNSPNWHIHTRKIDDWMIVFARDGKGYYEIEGVKYPIENGRIFFMSNNLSHSAAQDEKYPASVIAVRFCLYENSTGMMANNLLSPFGFSIKINQELQYRYLFENIYTNFKTYPDILGLSICDTLMSQVFNLIFQAMTQTFNCEDKQTKFENMRLYIEQNVLKDLSLLKTAQYFKLSPKYFSKLFKEQYGITYKKYIFKVRMEHAKFLLEETDYTVKNIASLLGYSDQYIFSNQFKLFTGKSPTKLRKK